MNLTNEQKSFLYDFLYEELDKLFKESEICKDCPYNYKCCYPGGVECKYHSNTGCTTKCLGCKAYLCDEKREELKDTPILIKLNYLSYLASTNGLIMYCLSKSDMNLGD
jgi:hypothetical protein